MEKVQSKSPSLKAATHWIISALGTFLFVFFMMAAIILFTTKMRGSYWFLPYFVLPSCLICITLGADYWIADDPLRRWSYFASTILCVVLMVPASLAAMLDYGTSTALRLYATILLPIFPILYGTSKIRNQNITGNPASSEEKLPRLEKHNPGLQNAMRMVCLLSICCVLFESGYRILSILYTLMLCKPESLVFGMFVPLPLFVLSINLLVRFIRVMFVPRGTLPNRNALKKSWRRAVCGALTITVAVFALTSAVLFNLRDAFIFGDPVSSYTRQELTELYWQKKDLLDTVQHSIMFNDETFQSQMALWNSDIDPYILEIQARFTKEEWDHIIFAYQSFHPYALTLDMDFRQGYFAFRMSFGKQKLDSGSKAISLYWFPYAEDLLYHRVHSLADSLAYTQMEGGWYIVEESYR